MTNDELKTALLHRDRVRFGGSEYTLSAVTYRVVDGKLFVQAELEKNNCVVIADPKEVEKVDLH